MMGRKIMGEEGNFDNVKACGYAIPSHWDIGKVYKRLIKI